MYGRSPSTLNGAMTDRDVRGVSRCLGSKKPTASGRQRISPLLFRPVKYKLSTLATAKFELASFLEQYEICPLKRHE